MDKALPITIASTIAIAVPVICAGLFAILKATGIF